MKFASLYVHPTCRQNKRVLDATSLIGIYSEIEERIPAVYVNYLVGARDSIEYIRELVDDDELFRRFIDWAEDKDALQVRKLFDRKRQMLSHFLRACPLTPVVCGLPLI